MLVGGDRRGGGSGITSTFGLKPKWRVVRAVTSLLKREAISYSPFTKGRCPLGVVLLKAAAAVCRAYHRQGCLVAELLVQGPAGENLRLAWLPGSEAVELGRTEVVQRRELA